MNVNEILQKPAFQNLEPARIEALHDLMLKLEGLGTAEALQLIIDFMKRIPKGRELTRPEQNAMMEAVMESLPENDKNRFKSMLKMLGMPSSM